MEGDRERERPLHHSPDERNDGEIRRDGVGGGGQYMVQRC